MRDWGRLRHNGRSLWWTVLGRNKRSITLNLRTEEGQEIARKLTREADVVLENFRPGTMEQWYLGPDDVREYNPRRRLRPRVAATGRRGVPRPAGVRVGRRGDGRAAAHQRLAGPGAAAQRHLARRHARRAVRLPGDPARPLLARRARRRGGQVVDASITDACFAITESAVLEFEKTGAVREPTGPRLPRIAPQQRVPLQRRALGRDRRQPRHAVAAAGRADGQAGAGGGRALRHPQRARGERGPARRGDRRSGRRSTPRRSSTGSSTRPAWCARACTRRPTCSRTRYFRERELLVEHEDEVHGTVTVPGIVPKLSRARRAGSAGRRAGRWAPTPTRCSATLGARGGRASRTCASAEVV